MSEVGKLNVNVTVKLSDKAYERFIELGKQAESESMTVEDFDQVAHDFIQGLVRKSSEEGFTNVTLYLPDELDEEDTGGKYFTRKEKE